MEECKKKGICYNYNEKFASSHHCATQKLYVLDVDAPMEPSKEDFEDAMIDIKEKSDQPAKVIPEITCNALYGFTPP